MAAGRFSIVYDLQASSEAEAIERIKGLCLEQTVELPAALVENDPFIFGTVVGRKESLVHLSGDQWRTTVSYDDNTTGFEFTQFLNVIFGNSSIKSGIKVEEILPSPAILAAFKGPKFGTSGIREAVGVPSGPLIQTALKPMGSSVEQLAKMAYEFALGGCDVIKDDHGLANQCWAPFDERVVACAAAVAKANKETGRTCVYAPCLLCPAHVLYEKAMFAKQAGAGAVLVLPGITGFDSMRMLAEDPKFNLPIIAHPALLGSHVRDGFSHAALFGTLCRMAGADATIFPNYGGRFGFTKEECMSIVDACAVPLGNYKPIFPTPGGGMTMSRIPQMIDEYNKEVMLLIGGDLIGHSSNLRANAEAFVKLLNR